MVCRSRLSIEVLRDFQLNVTVGESVAIVYVGLTDSCNARTDPHNIAARVGAASRL